MLSRSFSKLKEFDPKVCNSCGQCCHPEFQAPGGANYTVRHFVCKFLESDNNGATRCSVYKKRFKKAPWCMSVSEAIEQNKLPKDCPYVEDDPEYNGTNYASEDTEKHLLPMILAQINGRPVKVWLGPMGDK
jgi:uncharacterized cysteine cluster protein YcgN (CxxCxxCC family)